MTNKKEQETYEHSSEKYWEWVRSLPYKRYKKDERIYGCGIYIINWDNNDHFYIGKSKDMSSRMSRHLTMLRGGDHESLDLFNIFYEYGFPKFSVLKYCNEHELDLHENYYLNIFKTNPFLLNKNIPPSLDKTKLYINVELTKEEFDHFFLLNKEQNISIRDFIKQLE